LCGIIEAAKAKVKKQFLTSSNWGAKMIQCTDCELCELAPDGRRTFKCDPFSNIKEPECLAKWQLIRLDMLVASYQGMLKWYGKLAPLQDKIFKYMKREIDDMDESDRWKLDEQDNEPEQQDDFEQL
jgi:hypothetical protein